MSTFSRMFDMASKALDKKSGNTDRQSSSGDWRGMVRSAADALTGDSRTAPAAPRTEAPRPAPGRPSVTPPAAGATRGSAEDRAAIARYDYLMQTADPASVEQIHREAFERLTPEQRAQIAARMSAELPAYERPASSSPRDLARAAGRSEAARPGRMRGLLSRSGAMAGGAGLGILGAVAGGAILSTVAGPLLAQAGDFGVDFDALAEGVNLGDLGDLGGLGDLAGGTEGLLSGASEQVSGLGEQVGGLGEQLGGFELPSVRDFFGG